CRTARAVTGYRSTAWGTVWGADSTISSGCAGSSRDSSVTRCERRTHERVVPLPRDLDRARVRRADAVRLAPDRAVVGLGAEPARGGSDHLLGLERAGRDRAPRLRGAQARS